jgi:membrane-associated phospholipid phosphatase
MVFGSFLSFSQDSITTAATTNVDSDSTVRYRVNKTYLRSYWTDFKKVTTSPARWTGRNWRNVGITLGIAGVLFAADHEIKQLVMHNQSRSLGKASEILYPFGNTLSPAILAGMYVTSVITKNRKMEHASLQSAKAVVISTLFYTLTKATVPRKRPTYTNSPFVFGKPFKGQWEFTSFPSGHCNTVFSIATALAIEYKHTKWVPIVAYTIASLTGLSRMYQNRHWSSDVFIGSAMGHFITKAVYATEKKKQKRVLPVF